MVVAEAKSLISHWLPSALTYSLLSPSEHHCGVAFMIWNTSQILDRPCILHYRGGGNQVYSRVAHGYDLSPFKRLTTWHWVASTLNIYSCKTWAETCLRLTRKDTPRSDLFEVHQRQESINAAWMRVGSNIRQLTEMCLWWTREQLESRINLKSWCENIFRWLMRFQ